MNYVIRIVIIMSYFKVKVISLNKNSKKKARGIRYHCIVFNFSTCFICNFADLDSYHDHDVVIF